MKYGARVYFYEDDVIQVIQTVHRDGAKTYVLDCDKKGNPKQEHVNAGEDQASQVLDALRRAERGELMVAKKSHASS